MDDRTTVKDHRCYPGRQELREGASSAHLQEQGKFKVRALTRSPDKAEGLADEVVVADLTLPETLTPAFGGAYGVFANTNSFAVPDVDEVIGQF